MTVNDTTTKNAVLQALKDAMGAGGTITIRDSTPTVLAILTAVTFGTPSAGSMSFTATTDASNDATGTKNDAQFKTSGSTVIFTLASAEITVTGSIVASGTTALTSGSITL